MKSALKLKLTRVYCQESNQRPDFTGGQVTLDYKIKHLPYGLRLPEI